MVLRDLPRVVLSGKALSNRLEAVMLDATRDEFTPEGLLPMDKRAKALLDAALALAANETRSDDAAVAELTRLAKRRPDVVRVAENNARAAGEYVDLAVPNRAQRLLLAALSGQPVTQPSAEDRRRFELVGAFAQLPPQAAWDQLVTAVPGLGELARAVSGGQLGQHSAQSGSAQSGSAQSGSAQSGSAQSGSRRQFLIRLTIAVDTLVGPKSPTGDVLLKSEFVRTFVMSYLM